MFILDILLEALGIKILLKRRIREAKQKLVEEVHMLLFLPLKVGPVVTQLKMDSVLNMREYTYTLTLDQVTEAIQSYLIYNKGFEELNSKGSFKISIDKYEGLCTVVFKPS